MIKVVKVAIVGSAGRNNDGAKMSRELFDCMVTRTEKEITDILKLQKSKIVLVSGGSAWTDHVAVKLWLDSISGAVNIDDAYNSLELYLPCSYTACNTNGNCTRMRFDPNSDEGKTLNKLHTQFSTRMGDGFDSFADILCAKELGATVNTQYVGFHARNKQVAKVDHLIAFTWGDSVDKPEGGGTLHTWNHCRSRSKTHIPLKSLVRGMHSVEQVSSNTSTAGIGQQATIKQHRTLNDIWENVKRQRTE